MKSFKIKEAFHSIRNGANIKQDKTSGGIPVTRIETISESIIDLEKLGYAGITDDSFKNFYLQEGDILMSHINSVSHLGKVAIFENRNEIIIHGMNLLCLKAKKNILYPKYAYYFFRSRIFINSLKPITKKSVNQASFNISNFENIDILIPEKYADQVRIATVLSKVEALIKQRKESITLVNAFLKSTFLKMFGDPVRNEKGWETKQLGLVIRMKAGQFVSASDIQSVNNENLYPCFGGNGLRGYVKTFTHEGSFVLIGRQGALCGNVKVSKGRFHATEHAIVCTPKLELETNWLYYLLDIINLNKYASGAAQPGLNVGTLELIEIILPDIKLQGQFAQIVEKTEALKDQYKTSLQELENLFASLSQKAFKGGLDLSALQVLVPEEEYQSFTNDRTEPHHFERDIDLGTITVEVKKGKEDKRYGDPYEVDENTAKKQGGWFYKEWKRLNTQGSASLVTSIKTNSIVAGERLAIQIKEKYNDKYFNFEMLANFIKKSEAYDIDNYFSSEEIKSNPKYDESEDLKVFLETAIINVEMDEKQKENINPWLHLNQYFYDANKENINLELTKEDFALIKNRTAEERSGIYFNIVPDESN